MMNSLLVRYLTCADYLYVTRQILKWGKDRWFYLGQYRLGNDDDGQVIRPKWPEAT